MARGKTTNRAVADDQVQIDIRKVNRAGYLVPGADRVELLVNGTPTKVCLVHTRCALGGSRAWFQCPHCGKRCAILYVRRGIGCRTCHNLRYRVEAETEGSKAYRRANKLRERLGWFPGVAFGEGVKPPRMRWATFNRLLHQYRIAELQTIGASQASLSRIDRLIGSISRRES